MNTLLNTLLTTLSLSCSSGSLSLCALSSLSHNKSSAEARDPVLTVEIDGDNGEGESGDPSPKSSLIERGDVAVEISGGIGDGELTGRISNIGGNEDDGGFRLSIRISNSLLEAISGRGDVAVEISGSIGDGELTGRVSNIGGNEDDGGFRLSIRISNSLLEAITGRGGGTSTFSIFAMVNGYGVLTWSSKDGICFIFGSLSATELYISASHDCTSV